MKNSGGGNISVENINLDNLSKEELLEEVRSLQTQLRPNCADDSCSVLHDLQVHQLELVRHNSAQQSEAQQQLEETRENYVDLYDLAPVNYFSFDNKGIITNINLTAVGLLGQVRSSVIGRPFSKWLHINCLNQFQQHLLLTLQSDVKTSAELILVNETGQQFEVKIKSLRNKDLSSQGFKCRSVVIDVTETNRIKNELDLHARQLKLIADSLPVLLAYIDTDEKHLLANKTYVESFGFSLRDVLGRSPRAIWGRDNYKMARKFLTLALAGQQMKFDMELPLGEGGKKYFHTILIPDIDSEGVVCGVIVFIGDISDRIELEAIDRNRLLDIAHFSRLGTMGEMASEIAHELNQPLAAISMYSEACQRLISAGKANQSQIVRSFKDISKQASRAGEVIRHIRSFVSKKPVKKECIDINELVTSALQLLVVEIRSRKVKFELKLEQDIPLTWVDKILLEQVIFNLARNALEAMDNIEPAARELRIKTSVNPAGEIETTVADSGPGLSIADSKKIFEAFHSTKKDGMGMGLTMCYSIIDAHHGQIWASPNNFRGTTVSFTLPVLNKEHNYAI